MPLNLIDDKSSDREYFAILPTMLWPDIKLAASKDPTIDVIAAHARELGIKLDIYDKWLYATIKRVCGENGGQCFLSTRGLAKLAGMSVGQVSKSKAKLVQAGLVTIIAKKRSARGHPIDHITVVDIWERNIQTMKARQSVHRVNSSPHERNCSQGEPKCSQGETEEEPIEEEPIEETPDLFDLARRTEQARQKSGNYAETSEAGGSSTLADRLIEIYCLRLSEAQPRGHELISARATFERVLRRKKLSQDGALAERGLRVLLDPAGEWTFHFGNYAITNGENRAKLFETHYGKVLARLLAGGDGYSEQFKQKGLSHAKYSIPAARHAAPRRVATEDEARAILGDRYGG